MTGQSRFAEYRQAARRDTKASIGLMPPIENPIVNILPKALSPTLMAIDAISLPELFQRPFIRRATNREIIHTMRTRTENNPKKSLAHTDQSSLG